MPHKIWAVGEEVLAADFNDYVQEQVVATFPNAAARSTAIAAPNVGQLTYRADGGIYETWNGTAWTTIAGPGAGQRIYRIVSVDQTGITTAATDINGLTGTVTLPAGRRVQLNAELNFWKNAPDSTAWATFQITDGSNGVIVARNAYAPAPAFSSCRMSIRIDPPSGTNTWKVRASTTAGFLNIQATSAFWVDDVGPAGMPS